jgi:nitrous oxide reductase accessory protein NosL
MIRRTTATVVTAFLAAGLLFTAPAATAGQTVPCTECGMNTVVAGRFTARIVQGKEHLYFCDIGDLVAYLNRQKPAEFRAEVRDFPTGAWIDARSAFYARDKKLYKTPMGWGIAAFKDAAAAPGQPVSFDALRKAQP